MVSGEPTPLVVNPPGLEVIVYEVIADPPFETGALKVTVTCPLPWVAVPMIGASGTVAGTTELEVADPALSPSAFVAVTVKVYVTPFVNPVTVIGEVPPVAVIPPGEDVTVYKVIAEPPFLTGTEKIIVASPFPRVAVPMIGASGTVAGVAELLTAEATLVPTAFVAVTVKV